MGVLDDILEYAYDCITGKQISCKKHVWACMRLIRDVERIGQDDFPYVWDEEKARNIIEWFHELRHSKGVLAGKPIDLTRWQQFRICQLYGWVHKDTGLRRFKKTFTEVGRKNGKSQEEAGIALYEISVVAARNGEVAESYTAGTKKEQSKIVFKEAKLMLNGSPLKTKFFLGRTEIRHIKTGSTLVPLSKEDGKTGDGSNPALLVIDEYHQHPTTDFYDLGMGANTMEPLLMIITTAGKDLTFPCYVQEYQLCSRILDPGSDVNDDEYLVDICELDPEDYADISNVGNESIWVKANPIRATYPEGLELIRGHYKVAKEVPEKMTSFLTKIMDVWVQAKDGGYMDMSKWKACEVEEIPYDTTGKPVYVGLDMSSKLDLTSVAFVIPCETQLDDGFGNKVIQYVVHSHSFIPSREKLIEHVHKDHAAYDAWERAGYITITNTPIVDQAAVMRYILQTCEANEWKIEMLCFDPANASKLMMDLSDEGYECVEVFQSHKSLNESTQGFREQVYSGNILYTPNPVLNYAMSNAVIRKNNGLIKIDKDATTKRIDPVDAVLCAYKLAMYHIFSQSFEDTIDEFLAEY